MLYFRLTTQKHICLLFYPLLMLTLIGVNCTYAQIQDKDKNSIEIKYEGHIYIHAEVAGISGDFILDTGADNLYLDSTYYSNHSWNHKNKVKALLPGAGEKPKEIDYILDSVKLTFGNAHFNTPGVPVLDLKAIVGDIADGIIGFGYFKDLVLEVDYQNQIIRTYQNITQVDLEGYEKIEIEIFNNRILVPMRISVSPELTIKGKFLLDFGTSRNVILTSVCAGDNGLADVISKKAKYYSSHAGVGGESKGYDFRALDVRLGNNILSSPVLDYALDESGALASDNYEGLLGNGILDRFQVIIDYEGKSIYLKPIGRISDSFYASATGFAVANRSKTQGAWIVTHLHEGAQAESAGLLIGDHITHINNKPVGEISYQERIAWHRSQKKIRLRVKRKDAKPFSIDLTLKPVI